MAEISGVWIFIIGGIVGALIGFVISRITSGTKQKAAQQKELDDTKAELENYKSQVSNHFNNSAQLMGQVASSYQALYSHMAGQSEALLSDTDSDALPFPQLKTALEKKREEPQVENEVAPETEQESLAAKEAAQETTPEPLAAQEAVQEAVASAAQEVPQADATEEPRETKAKDSAIKANKIEATDTV